MFSKFYNRALKGKYFLWFPVVLHLWWSALLLFSETPLNITALHSTSVKLKLSALPLSFLFFGVSLSSIISLWKETSKLTTIGMLPQQFLLMLSAEGAVQCIINSQFADGVIRPWPFIAADQFPAILTALFHTWVLVEVFILRRESN